MMRADVKQLNKAVRIGASEKLDRVRANCAMVKRQVAAASLDDGRDWYAIRVRVNCEMAVDNAMRDAGIGTWLPLRLVEGLVRRGRKLPPTSKPVLWGLLFVHVPMSADAWHGLMSFKHVLSVLGDSDGPKPVLEKQFNSFRTMVTLGVYGDKPKDWAVGVGDIVGIGAGAAMGMNATVLAIKGKRQDRIIVRLFGGQRPIEVPLAHLVKP